METVFSIKISCEDRKQKNSIKLLIEKFEERNKDSVRLIISPFHDLTLFEGIQWYENDSLISVENLKNYAKEISNLKIVSINPISGESNIIKAD